MTLFEHDEHFISDFQKIVNFKKYRMENTAKDRVLEKIHQEFDSRNDSTLHDKRTKRFTWRKKVISAAATVAFIFASMGTVAMADGVNVLNVMVDFVRAHVGGSYGTSQSLANTSVDLSNTEGHVFETSYNSALSTFLGTNHFPKLAFGKRVVIKNIQAWMVNSKKQEYYMFVNGYIPNTANQNLQFNVYHNIAGTVQIWGQTTRRIKQKVKVAKDINGTYTEMTNGKSFFNYVSWKSGNWILVLRSSNISKKSLVQGAQNIESQIK